MKFRAVNSKTARGDTPTRASGMTAEATMARTAEEAMNAYAVHACIGTGVRLYALRFPIFRRSSPPITTQKCRADDGRRDPRGGARSLPNRDPR